MGIVPKCLNFICYYMVKDFFKILTDKHTFIYTHIHIYLGTCYVYHISHLKTQTPARASEETLPPFEFQEDNCTESKSSF